MKEQLGDDPAAFFMEKTNKESQTIRGNIEKDIPVYLMICLVLKKRGVYTKCSISREKLK